jgi:hypothetical protein
VGHPNAARVRDDNGAADTTRSFADIHRDEAGSTHRRILFDDDPAKVGNAACNEQCSERSGCRSGGGVFLHSNQIEEAVEVDQKELRIMERKACSCARSSSLKAQKRPVLACPVLYEVARSERFELPTLRFEVLLHPHL